MAEGRMNLAALQQRDPYISEIVDTASQVALYSFNSKANEWEKTSIEGSLFVYKRSASPVHGFMILNRLGLNNLIEPITKDLEFQPQDPFLLYRNAKAIYGIWFYEKDECGRLGQLMNRFLSETLTTHHSPKPQQRAPETESMQSKGKVGHAPPSQVDIMQMLSKAQQEYDTSKVVPTVGAPKKTEPKPMIDNPNAAATKNSNLIRPMPLKIPESESASQEQEEGDSQGASGPSATPGTAPISLDALFRTASLQQQGGSVAQYPAPDLSTVPKSSGLHRSVSMTASTSKQPSEPGYPVQEKKRSSEGDDLPLLLKHIMSTGSMVEDIERLQIETDRPPPPLVRPTTHGVGFSLGPKEEALTIVPDVSVPPPIHPAYRGPSPHHPNVSKASPRLFQHSGIVSGNLSNQQPSASQDVLKVASVGKTDRQVGKAERLTPQGMSPRGDADSGSEKPGSSPVGVKSGPALLTPAELVSQQTSTGSVPADKPVNPNLAAAAASLAPDVLLSPMAFLTSSRKTPPAPSLPERAVVEEKTEDSLPIAALTKQQLQQALLHLVKNDSGFISKLHEAYLKSLQELSGHKS